MTILPRMPITALIDGLPAVFLAVGPQRPGLRRRSIRTPAMPFLLLVAPPFLPLMIDRHIMTEPLIRLDCVQHAKSLPAPCQRMTYLIVLIKGDGIDDKVEQGNNGLEVKQSRALMPQTGFVLLEFCPAQSWLPFMPALFRQSKTT